MGLLRKIAFPFSLVYALVVHIRNGMYDIGWLASKRYTTPIICIGNLSVGGTGKTPMTEFLIKNLREHYHLAVLSRGYKRASSGYVLADERSTVSTLGDEPYQMYQKFKPMLLAVDADRRNGIDRLLKKDNPDVILLDDAYQHRKVHPKVRLLLTAYGDLYIDDWYLPTGNLRDAKYVAKNAAKIIVTKCPENLSVAEKKAIELKLKPTAKQQVLFSFLQYSDLIKSETTEKPLNHLKQQPFTLVTGIANPRPLITYLKELGLKFDHMAFNDHHNFTTKEIAVLQTKGTILTTEKDYVRLKNKIADLWYLPVAHQFMDGGDAQLLAFLKREI
ncbi:tetraacyldisaccharide 4'-kinase [Flavobacterium sp. ASW18X]|uniref:tetraacyldisaccharide 4'-kinase n=1 Tax=Flavobacterium sp. ASW18X TaxID=2572595 RepID=UPI0010AE0E2F|nr:tetraacyldisaccharide 4'-kinase [Flavobacterium sp. ASW18X]TKD56549.1 tetraacyldisaccharide 4'-kinase [Flavobacterium sp. ASW18X]